MIAEQDVGMTYLDLANLKLPKELRSHPTNYFEFEKSLGTFGNLIGAILGDRHPLTVAYREFCDTFNAKYKEQIHFELDTRKVIKPVHLLHSIQLVVFKWFQAKKFRCTPANPPFTDILDRISLHMYTNPVRPPDL